MKSVTNEIRCAVDGTGIGTCSVGDGSVAGNVNRSLTSISVSKDVHRRLLEIQGNIQHMFGKRYSLDVIVGMLCLGYAGMDYELVRLGLGLTGDEEGEGDI